MKYLCNVVLAMGVLSVGIANADIPNYKYAELSYGTGELDLSITGEGSVDIDQDGFQIEGSYSFLEDQLWVFGSYADVDGSESGVKVGVETTRLGAGWIFTASDNATIDVSVLYRDDDFEIDGESVDGNGLGVAVGGRLNASELIEVYGRLGYLSSDYEGAWTIDVGGVFNINERFALTLSAEYFDFDDDGLGLELIQLQAGVRVKF